jgi:hypothetical protein
MAEEEKRKGGGKGSYYKSQERTVFVKVDDLDLDTPKGQDEMLKRMQILIATTNHNALDLKAFATLKDTVRVKTDLNVLRLFTIMKAQMDAWKAAKRAENT